MILADKEKEMRNMIKKERIKKYLDKKGMELNVRETKVMRFKKRDGRMIRKTWREKGN